MAKTTDGGYDPVDRVLNGGPRVTVSSIRRGETDSFDTIQKHGVAIKSWRPDDEMDFAPATGDGRLTSSDDWDF